MPSMMDRAMLSQVFGQGLLIGIASMAAFYIGLSQGGAALASTMAFSTLTLARLFHGFNCRGKESIFRLGLRSNPYSLMAFAAGVVLLALVLFVPALESLFLVAAVTGTQLLWILLLALLRRSCFSASAVPKNKNDPSNRGTKLLRTAVLPSFHTRNR